MSPRYTLVQPSPRRRWELRQGDQLIATLDVPVLRRRATARVGDERWQLEIKGEGRRTEDVRVELRPRLLRSSGTIEVRTAMPRREAIELALLAACRAIRKADRDAAAGTAAISSTSV
jgi:hypothetical protein